MAGYTGQTKINNSPDFLGQLFQVGQRPNPTLGLLGGFQGGVIPTTSREFPTGVFYDLAAPSQPSVLEGANAPTADGRALTQATNVVQIFHRSVETTYLGQSDRQVSGVVPIPLGQAQGQPIHARDQAFQVQMAIQGEAQNMNYSFLRGTFANPADPSGTALRTRGILTSMTTTNIDNSAFGGTVTEAIYRGYVESLVKSVVVASNFQTNRTWTILADANQYGNLQAAYQSAGQQFVGPGDTIMGIKLLQINTRMGLLNIVLEPDMPADTIAIVNFSVCGVVGLEVPGKGFFFEEALAKVGSADRSQLYGQFGVAHGPEYMHGKLLVKAAVAL